MSEYAPNTMDDFLMLRYSTKFSTTSSRDSSPYMCENKAVSCTIYFLKEVATTSERVYMVFKFECIDENIKEDQSV